ncbi:MAG TPA: hypothetical protein VND93_33145 [Myxococcales bacterium]|nr:hypothetical protein [Myxococcales bacterium]
MADDEALAKLERRISKLEGGGKDVWDKFQILAALLVPAAVAFAGYYFSNAVADAQRQAEDHRAQASQMVAEASTRVSQAELISTFMRSLLSDNRAEKNLAIQAVILALPEEGPQLVAAIQISTSDPETKQAAKHALEDRREKLVHDLHAPDEASRQHAAQALVLGFRQDPELAQQITAEAEKHPEDRAGVVSSAEVLRAVPREQMVAHPEVVKRFAKVAEPHGDATRSLLQQIKLHAAPPPPPKPE